MTTFETRLSNSIRLRSAKTPSIFADASPLPDADLPIDFHLFSIQDAVNVATIINESPAVLLDQAVSSMLLDPGFRVDADAARSEFGHPSDVASLFLVAWPIHVQLFPFCIGCHPEHLREFTAAVRN